MIEVERMSVSVHVIDSPQTVPDAENENTFFKLKKLHLAAAIFMGIQTIAYGCVNASVHVKPTVGFPTSCNGPICEPDMRVIAERNPIFLIVLFVALASFDHIVTWVVAHRHQELAMHWLFEVQSNPLRLVYILPTSIYFTF